MNRGIVMEVQKRNVIVLTPDGQFIRCLKKGREYQIGEEIYVAEEEISSVKKRPMIWKPALLMVCSLLIAFMFLYTGRPEKALAYVAIDINPSLEASVDENLQVLDIDAYNDDGERVLRKLTDWKGKPIGEVITAVVTQSRKDGYLAKKQVTLTYVAETQEIDGKLSRSLQDLQKSYQGEVAVATQKSTVEERNAAKKAGLTTGMYQKQQAPPVVEQPEKEEKKEQKKEQDEKQTVPGIDPSKQPEQKPEEKLTPLVPQQETKPQKQKQKTAPGQQKKEKRADEGNGQGQEKKGGASNRVQNNGGRSKQEDRNKWKDKDRQKGKDSWKERDERGDKDD